MQYDSEMKILNKGFDLLKLWTEFEKSEDKEKQKEIDKLRKDIDKDQKEVDRLNDEFRKL